MKKEFKKVCVVGLGYIGLPTSAIFASRGIDVIGVDINQSVVDTINRGDIHIVEPDLDVIVKKVVVDKKLLASTEPESADAFLIVVPTPFKGENHEPNLDYIKAASESVARVLKKDDLIVLESTSPVGTTEKLSYWLAQERKDLTFPHQAGEDSDIKIAYCPERVLPGYVVRELVENDRILGGMTTISGKYAIELYKIFVKGECFLTNAKTAEMAKLTENAFRDVNIAFANELSILCDKIGIDVWELISLSNKHPRVNILNPGCGVGGHCIAVDPWFIVNAYPEESKLIRSAREVNDGKSDFVIHQIKKEIDRIGAKSIACLGLSFKPDIDDLRESPALKIVSKLADDIKIDILAVEPNIHTLPRILKEKINIQLVSLELAIREADLIVILVRHREFENMKRVGCISFVDRVLD